MALFFIRVNSRRFAAACLWLLSAATPCCHAQISEAWFPVTARDLKFKEVPGAPGAPAVMLEATDSTDDVLRSRFIHRRVKVLNEGGRRYADVVIPVPPDSSVTDIRARTIRRDGGAVEFSGKPFEKVLLRRAGRNLVAKTFSLPQVCVGCMVEYKYRVIWEKLVFDTVWEPQHDLYTLRERFWLRPYQGMLQTRHGGDETRLSYVYSNLPEGVAPRETAAGIELTVENVPAFVSEASMPPPDNFKPQVRFFYGGREIESPEAFWRDMGREWYEKSEKFMGRTPQMESGLAEIVGQETDPLKKLRAIYARTRRIRNLSYEPVRTRVETKKEELKPNDHASDVLAHGYGFSNEIAELFAALARAAGVQADILRVSSREERVFDPRLLSGQQLPWELVRVRLDGADLFLDPGTPMCPFGLVWWPYTSGPALKLDREGGEFVTVPTSAADKAVTRRTASMTLSPDGALRGEVTVKFEGLEALQRRLDALGTDEAGAANDLESELLSRLPVGSTVHLRSAEGRDSVEEPLALHFDAAVPGFAVKSERRLLVPARLFQEVAPEIFTATRRYPVYFPYTWSSLDNVSIRLPAGYSVESIPDGREMKLASTRFIATRSLDADTLKEFCGLAVNSIYFEPEKYSELKGFFDRLRAAGEEHTVLGLRPGKP